VAFLKRLIGITCILHILLPQPRGSVVHICSCLVDSNPERSELFSGTGFIAWIWLSLQIRDGCGAKNNLCIGLFMNIKKSVP
jgi:hypothetical protein